MNGYAGRCPTTSTLDVLPPEDAKRPMLQRLLWPMAPVRQIPLRCVKSTGHAGRCLQHLPGGAVILMRGKG